MSAPRLTVAFGEATALQTVTPHRNNELQVLPRKLRKSGVKRPNTLVGVAFSRG